MIPDYLDKRESDESVKMGIPDGKCPRMYLFINM